MIEYGTTFNVLDKGFIQVIDWMGSDAEICNAARISYGKGTRSISDDTNLIRYLMRHNHCYTGEMEVLTLEGWKKWKNCRNTEWYLVPSPYNKSLHPEKLETKIFNINEKILTYKNSRMSFNVTYNHTIYFKTKYSEVFEKIPAYLMPKWGHFQPLSGYQLVNPVGEKDPLFQFIGFTLGDGGWSGSQISFHLKKERKKNYLKTLLSQLNWNFSITPSSTYNDASVFRVEVPLDIITKYIEKGCKSFDKRFLWDKDLLGISHEAIRGLWDGLCNSDGSLKQDRPQYQFSSVSFHLDKLFQTLSAFQGIDAHTIFQSNEIYSSTSYHGTRTTLESRPQYYGEKEYDGSVYCATTSTGLLVVRGSEDTFAFICGNTTPFEMCELKLCVKVPMDIWRQWIRHRTASVNEYSTRYSEAINDKQETNLGEWRLQSTTNKQGSSEFLDLKSGEILTTNEYRLHQTSKEIYEQRLLAGVAKEQARKDLPLSTYTKAFWKIDLHNLLHFLRLRMDSHAQLEIRSYANIIGNEIVSQLWPITWQAFQDYRLQSISLTRLDKEVIQFINRNCTIDGEEMGLSAFMNNIFSNKRESEECVSKLKQLGFINYATYS